MASTEADCFAITGDIGEARSVERYCRLLESSLQRPIYFVLGNHDFLIVRKVGRGLVVDLIDPHSIGLADAPAKAAGLAKFAALHGDKFGRILLVMLDGKTSKTLDLTEETVREKVQGVKLPEQLRKLFDEA